MVYVESNHQLIPKYTGSERKRNLVRTIYALIFLAMIALFPELYFSCLLAAVLTLFAIGVIYLLIRLIIWL